MNQQANPFRQNMVAMQLPEDVGSITLNGLVPPVEKHASGVRYIEVPENFVDECQSHGLSRFVPPAEAKPVVTKKDKKAAPPADDANDNADDGAGDGDAGTGDAGGDASTDQSAGGTKTDRPKRISTRK